MTLGQRTVDRAPPIPDRRTPVIRVTPHDGPRGGYRCYIADQRLHHGVTGLVLIAIGAALVAHDRRDARIWFRRDRPLDKKAAEE